jgi:transposase
LELTAAERRRLVRALRQQAPQGVALRAAIVLLSAQGQSAPRIATALGVTTRTVQRCRRRWRQQGLAGLADVARPSSVSAEYLRLLMRTVETAPEELGFAFTRWTRARLAAYLQQRTGVRPSARWVGGKSSPCPVVTGSSLS